MNFEYIKNYFNQKASEHNVALNSLNAKKVFDTQYEVIAKIANLVESVVSTNNQITSDAKSINSLIDDLHIISNQQTQFVDKLSEQIAHFNKLEDLILANNHFVSNIELKLET